MSSEYLLEVGDIIKNIEKEVSLVDALLRPGVRLDGQVACADVGGNEGDAGRSMHLRPIHADNDFAIRPSDSASIEVPDAPTFDHWTWSVPRITPRTADERALSAAEALNTHR